MRNAIERPGLSRGIMALAALLTVLVFAKPDKAQAEGDPTGATLDMDKFLHHCTYTGDPQVELTIADIGSTIALIEEKLSEAVNVTSEELADGGDRNADKVYEAMRLAMVVLGDIDVKLTALEQSIGINADAEVLRDAIEEVKGLREEYELVMQKLRDAGVATEGESDRLMVDPDVLAATRDQLALEDVEAFFAAWDQFQCDSVAEYIALYGALPPIPVEERRGTRGTSTSPKAEFPEADPFTSPRGAGLLTDQVETNTAVLLTQLARLIEDLDGEVTDTFEQLRVLRSTLITTPEARR